MSLQRLSLVNHHLMFSDEYWLGKALALAKVAAENGEVPVGAVMVKENQLIGCGQNSPIGDCDPTAHAEILAIRAAASYLNNYRLVDTTLYVTLEPCLMCAAALVHARVARVVFGAYDAKAGAVGSQITALALRWLNHRVVYQGGVLQQECSALLTAFFRARRLMRK